MKPKSIDFRKKLTLNKKTIANLSNERLAKAKGGLPPTTDFCITYDISCLPYETCMDCPTEYSCQCVNSVKQCIYETVAETNLPENCL